MMKVLLSLAAAGALVVSGPAIANDNAAAKALSPQADSSQAASAPARTAKGKKAGRAGQSQLPLILVGVAAAVGAVYALSESGSSR